MNKYGLEIKKKRKLTLEIPRELIFTIMDDKKFI